LFNLQVIQLIQPKVLILGAKKLLVHILGENAIEFEGLDISVVELV
jgi:hypothetical protein